MKLEYERNWGRVRVITIKQHSNLSYFMKRLARELALLLAFKMQSALLTLAGRWVAGVIVVYVWILRSSTWASPYSKGRKAMPGLLWLHLMNAGQSFVDPFFVSPPHHMFMQPGVCPIPPSCNHTNWESTTNLHTCLYLQWDTAH